jgi:hypothetical protein
MANGDTKNTNVTFSLWAVLGFLCAIAFILFGDLYGSQRSNQKANQDVCDRVTKLEANYNFIIDGIKEIKDGQKEVASALASHERSTLEKKEAETKVKRWQDVPASRGN